MTDLEKKLQQIFPEHQHYDTSLSDQILIDYFTQLTYFCKTNHLPFHKFKFVFSVAKFILLQIRFGVSKHDLTEYTLHKIKSVTSPKSPPSPPSKPSKPTKPTKGQPIRPDTLEVPGCDTLVSAEADRPFLHLTPEEAILAVDQIRPLLASHALWHRGLTRGQAARHMRLTLPAPLRPLPLPPLADACPERQLGPLEARVRDMMVPVAAPVFQALSAELAELQKLRNELVDTKRKSKGRGKK
eukprot:gnl/Dysnectes_brevis/2575_a3101_889.p1 GENE.gnl/Dysnectes_brevis/2575_a3101_889~~gnl/Dysnectes_brevis/2575_a3101_889.p1  ORF type:complete len:271 (+),score=47.21 gnl/Dysnectes_brevis/2575_a3101_889:89-814(+)